MRLARAHSRGLFEKAAARTLDAETTVGVVSLHLALMGSQIPVSQQPMPAQWLFPGPSVMLYFLSNPHVPAPDLHHNTTCLLSGSLRTQKYIPFLQEPDAPAFG